MSGKLKACIDVMFVSERETNLLRKQSKCLQACSPFDRAKQVKIIRSVTGSLSELDKTHVSSVRFYALPYGGDL